MLVLCIVKGMVLLEVVINYPDLDEQSVPQFVIPYKTIPIVKYPPKLGRNVNAINKNGVIGDHFITSEHLNA